MPEFFELTFFEKASGRQKAKKSKSNASCLDIHGLLDHAALSAYPWACEAFHDSDLSEFTISIADFHFTHKNFDSQLEKLANAANRVFSASEEILFATGIYELTAYNLEHINAIEDFDPETLKRFPLLFYRSKEEVPFSPYKTGAEVSIVYHPFAQDIFADPITTIMEDEQLDYHAALEKQGL